MCSDSKETEAEKQRGFLREEAEKARTFERDQANAARTFEKGQAEAAQRFAADQASRAREAETTRTKNAQEFESKKVCFHENSEHVRDMNKFLWQVPMIAITLTGGLWYAIINDAIVSDVRQPLLFFAFIANLGFIIIVLRVRYVFEQILAKTRAFNDDAKIVASGKQPWQSEGVVAHVFIALMILAAIISLAGALAPSKLFSQIPPAKSSLATKDALKVRAYRSFTEH